MAKNSTVPDKEHPVLCQGLKSWVFFTDDIEHVLLQSVPEVSLYALARTVELSKPMVVWVWKRKASLFALSIHPR